MSTNTCILQCDSLWRLTNLIFLLLLKITEQQLTSATLLIVRLLSSTKVILNGSMCKQSLGFQEVGIKIVLFFYK